MNPECSRQARKDDFQTYLTYKPAGDSIWVTLAVLEWGWHGEAVYDTSSGKWNIQNTNAYPGLMQESTVIPKWNANVEQVEPTGVEETYDQIVEGLRALNRPVP